MFIGIHFACAAGGRGRSIVNAPYNPRTLLVHDSGFPNISPSMVRCSAADVVSAVHRQCVLYAGPGRASLARALEVRPVGAFDFIFMGVSITRAITASVRACYGINQSMTFTFLENVSETLC